jgi:hypothetical protein
MEEYVESVLINMARREFTLFSTEGDERVVNCETIDQFMSVLELINDSLDEELIFYTNPVVTV